MTQTVSLAGKIALGLSALFGLVFSLIGLLWLVAPAIAAGALGASLLQGTGLATQIGDSSSFFFCAGVFLLFGVFRRNASLLVAGALLIGLVAPARVVAWHLHGAALTLDTIAVELLTLAVALVAAAAVRRP